MSCPKRLLVRLAIRRRNSFLACIRFYVNCKTSTTTKYITVKSYQTWSRPSSALWIVTSRTTWTASQSAFKARFQRHLLQPETVKLYSKCFRHFLWRTRRHQGLIWVLAPTTVLPRTTTEMEAAKTSQRKESGEHWGLIRTLTLSVLRHRLRWNQRL